MFSDRSSTIQLVAWLALYAVLLTISITVIDRHDVTNLALRIAVGVMPMIAAFGVLDLAIRRHRQSDELQRKITAEGIMFAFGTTAIVTFTYGFLQRSADAPDISYFFVWPILATSWIVGTFLANRRYR